MWRVGFVNYFFIYCAIQIDVCILLVRRLTILVPPHHSVDQYLAGVEIIKCVVPVCRRSCHERRDIDEQYEMVSHIVTKCMDANASTV